MSDTMLQRALSDPRDPALRRLPHDVEVLLTSLGAPPRLAAHLRLVHDVAFQLVSWVRDHHGIVNFDQAAVLFGAATHDIGKFLHVDELSGPGSAHEQAGYELLLAHGVDEELARFARTHATWAGADVGMEDLLVSLADKVWKAKRVADLEQLVVDRLATSGDQESWQVFMTLDDELGRIAAGADRRLAFQSDYAVLPA